MTQQSTSATRPITPPHGLWRSLFRCVTDCVGALLDAIFPPLCTVCRRRLEPGERHICTVCMATLPRPRYRDIHVNPLAQRLWGVCPVDSAVTAFSYVAGDALSMPVWAMKYYHRRRLGLFLGEAMAAEPLVAKVLEDIDVLLPMPLTRWRQWQRGYNQCELLCRGMARATGAEIVTDALRRTKFSGSQTRKSREERRRSVENAFALRDASRLIGRRVAVVDDIVTTGATVSACLEVLRTIPGIRLSVIALAQTDTSEG